MQVGVEINMLDNSVLLLGICVLAWFMLKAYRMYFSPLKYTDNLQDNFLNLQIYRRYRTSGYNAFKIAPNNPIISNIKEMSNVTLY